MVSAVFCAHDQMALGALQSLDARKVTGKIKLVGFDGAVEAARQIVAKKMYATIALMARRTSLAGVLQEGREEARGIGG